MEKNVIVLFLDPREEYEIVIVEGAPGLPFCQSCPAGRHFERKGPKHPLYHGRKKEEKYRGSRRR